MSLDSSLFCSTELTDWPHREDAEVVTVRVCAVERCAAGLLEISVAAPELMEHRLVGPDEFFGLLIPQPGNTYVPVTREGAGNLRGHLAKLPEAERPDLRWYTVRRLDRSAGTLTFHLVTHGVIDPADPGIGPALRWALSVAPGDTCGICPANGLWFRRPTAVPVSQVLVADPTAAPSVAAILEFLANFHPRELRTTAVVLAATEPDSFELGLTERWAHRVGAFHVVIAPQGRLLDAVVGKLRALGGAGHVWCCGERAFAAGVRRFAVREWGMDPKDVTFSAFWILGQPRG